MIYRADLKINEDWLLLSKNIDQNHVSSDQPFMILKQRKDIVQSPRKILPSFMDKMQGNIETDVKKELSELQGNDD